MRVPPHRPKRRPGQGPRPQPEPRSRRPPGPARRVRPATGKRRATSVRRRCRAGGADAGAGAAAPQGRAGRPGLIGPAGREQGPGPGRIAPPGPRTEPARARPEGVGRLLLIRRGERAGGSEAAGASTRLPAAAAAGVDAGRAGAPLVELLLDTVVSGRRGASAAPPSSRPDAGADFAALVDLAAFFAGAGSSGWTGRRRPSASALRRTRSACASSMEDEWLLTPIPRERASSSPSLLVRPSSLASS